MGSARRCRPRRRTSAADLSSTPRGPRARTRGRSDDRAGTPRARRDACARSSWPRTPGVPLGPNPRVGCVLLDPDGTTVAEGYHRGAGTPHAEADALARGRRPGPRAPPPWSPSSPATTPAAPGRAPRRWSRPGWPGWCSPRPTPTRSPPGGADDAARRRRRRRGRPAGRRGPRRQPGLDVRGRARPAVRDLEARHHARRPQRRRRRHQSRWVSSLPARRDTHRLRGQCDAILVGTGTVLVDDPQLTVRDEDDVTAAPRAAAAARGDGHCASVPADRRVLDDAAETCCCAPATRTRRSPRCSRATGGTCSSRAGRPWRRRSSRAGLVDEVVALRRADAARRRAAAPSATWASATIADALHLDVADVTMLGTGADTNVRLTMTPAEGRP